MKKASYLLIAVLLSGCVVDDPFFTDNGGNLMTISSDKSSIVADGRDVLPLDITLKYGMDTLTKITVSCNYGFLDSSIQTLNTSHSQSISMTPTNGKLHLYLRADSTAPNGDLIVESSLKNISTSHHFSINWSFADDLVLSTPVDSLAATDSLPVTVSLSRSTTYPTSGTKVLFSVYPDPNTSASGNVPPYAFTSGVTANVKLRSSGTTTGTVQLKAMVIGANGDTLSRMRSIRIY